MDFLISPRYRYAVSGIKDMRETRSFTWFPGEYRHQWFPHILEAGPSFIHMGETSPFMAG